MDSDTTTTAAATHTASTDNLIQFTPRASSEACAWVASVDVTPRAKAVGRAVAAHAAYAAVSTSWRHVERGDLVARPSYETLAFEMGISARTVKRGMAELIAAGLERRRTRRTNTYIFPAVTDRRQPVTPPVTLCVTPKGPRTEPRSEPRTPSTSCRRKRVAHPDRPATARQRSTILAMADERGLANPLWPTITRAQADGMIQYVTAKGGALVKRVYRHDAPPTAAQLSLLQVLGVSEVPGTRGEADTVIQRRAA